jgi:hypothetical protein
MTRKVVGMGSSNQDRISHTKHRCLEHMQSEIKMQHSRRHKGNEQQVTDTKDGR